MEEGTQGLIPSLSYSSTFLLPPPLPRPPFYPPPPLQSVFSLHSCSDFLLFLIPPSHSIPLLLFSPLFPLAFLFPLSLLFSFFHFYYHSCIFFCVCVRVCPNHVVFPSLSSILIILLFLVSVFLIFPFSFYHCFLIFPCALTILFLFLSLRLFNFDFPYINITLHRLSLSIFFFFTVLYPRSFYFLKLPLVFFPSLFSSASFCFTLLLFFCLTFISWFTRLICSHDVIIFLTLKKQKEI